MFWAGQHHQAKRSKRYGFNNLGNVWNDAIYVPIDDNENAKHDGCLPKFNQKRN